MLLVLSLLIIYNLQFVDKTAFACLTNGDEKDQVPGLHTILLDGCVA